MSRVPVPPPVPEPAAEGSRWRRPPSRADLVAGLTTAVLLVPQAMAYAMLAGLPPITGLYAATLPLVAYAVVGRSRVLAVGPVAMDSLLVAAALAPFAAVAGSDLVALAAVLALMVGVLQLGLGLLRAGTLFEVLQRPVVRGFSAAAAILIALSQLSNVLGSPLPSAMQPLQLIAALPGALATADPATVGVGAMAVLVLVALKRWAPKVPRALVVVVVSVAAVGLLRLDTLGVSIVGELPSGLPRIRVPELAWGDVVELLPSALLIALVAFTEAASLVRVVGTRKVRTPNRQFFGLGAANIASALVGGYPVTASFSRTVVHADAGARSRWSGVVTAAAVVATLMFLTSWFYYLPKAALAAIILVAVAKLIDVSEPRTLWASRHRDFGLWLLTFVATLALGLGAGMGLGLLASFLDTKFPGAPAVGPEGTTALAEDDEP